MSIITVMFDYIFDYFNKLHIITVKLPGTKSKSDVDHSALLALHLKTSHFLWFSCI